MKMPKRPPDARKIFEKIAHADRLSIVFQASQKAVNDGKYYHWDKLRHLKPPGGLSHEEWWLALKNARSSFLFILPFKNITGKRFWFNLPSPIPEYLHHIDQDASGRIAIADPEISNPSTKDRYLIHSLVEEAITSSQLEGAAVTRPVAKEMIRSGRTPRDRGEQMILNNYIAMKKIQRLKDKPLSKKLVLDLHRIITDKTLENPSAAGRFRRVDEEIHVVSPENEILHIPPPADELARRFRVICDFANGKTPQFFIHPAIRSIILHFWLAYDHPFVDGNGRCARSLFYWSMLRQGYWLCEFISISQIIKEAAVKYGRAFLYTETDDNDLTYFILYHLKLIRRAIDELHSYINRKTEQMRVVTRLIRGSSGLNHRQKDLLGHALRHPDAEYTIQAHRDRHNVVYQTARIDLLELEKKGLLERHETGRRFCFVPSKNLQAKFKGHK